ncbi:ankyrin repeat-containing domain protein, partial [Flagelloscypha sp. PMI_526]
VAYYFFEFSNFNTLSEEALFRSLVAQLSYVNEAYARGMYEKHRKGAVQPQLATLQAAFYSLASEAAEPVYVVIDALDELPPLQRTRLLKTLEKTWSIPHRHLHLIVTSRDDVDASEHLDGKVQYELAVEDAMIRRDIAVVIEKELSSAKWTSWPEKECARVREQLNNRADGQFRIVACQIEVLRKAQTSHDLRRALELLPKKLGDTYSYILESVPEDLRVRAHTLLSILSFAFEPVPLSELSAILAVELDDSTDETHLPRYCEDLRYYQPQNIIGLGSALVRTEHLWGPGHPPFLQLAHASVKEYLLQNEFHWSFIDEKLAHEMISRACLALLLHNLTSQVDKRLTVDAYIRHWWYHHVPSEGGKQLLALQIALFQTFPWTCLRDFEIPLDAIGQVNQSELLRYPMTAAAAAGLVDMLNSMLATDQEVNILNHALVVAAATGADLPVITRLVGQGANINTLNEAIGTPLQSAASCGALEVVKFLVSQGACIDLQGGYYGTPLNAAASEGKMEVVEFLLSKDADVNLTGRSYGTPLQAAASLGRLDVVELLAAHGADMNIVAGDYGTALQAAAFIGSLHVVEFLVTHGAHLNIVGGIYGTALLAAAFEGEVKVVDFLIRKGANVNVVAGEYGTALQAAAWTGSLDVVELLVVNGADIDTVGGKYGTALLAAVSEGEKGVVEFLVRKGADLNIVVGEYGTALHAAACMGSLDTVEILVGNGADLNIVGGKYGMALLAAASEGKTEVVDFFLNRSSQVDPIAVNCRTPLHVAAIHGHMSVTQALLKYGANPNTTNYNHRTPLHLAAKNGHHDVVQALLDFGANPYTVGQSLV